MDVVVKRAGAASPGEVGVSATSTNPLEFGCVLGLSTRRHLLLGNPLGLGSRSFAWAPV